MVKSVAESFRLWVDDCRPALTGVTEEAMRPGGFEPASDALYDEFFLMVVQSK